MKFFRELATEIYQVSWTLFKLMIPALIVVKVLEELGFVAYLGVLLEPLMAIVGLPESMGLVWATTILTNIYAGMLVFFYAQQGEAMTVAQVTVIAGLMLMAHGLPVEARIAQQAGVRLRVTLLLRIGGGFLFGWLLHKIYSLGGWLQQPNELLWQPPAVDNSLLGWGKAQLESLLIIQLIVIVLLTVLKVLRSIGVERLMAIALRPLLSLLGIGRNATTITIVGVTLGLAFGGGLLIKEARAGHVSKRDIFAAMSLLAFCHSLIEDTLLVMLLGAHISGALWIRLAFSIAVVALMTRLLDCRSDSFWQRHLVNRHIDPVQTG